MRPIMIAFVLASSACLKAFGPDVGPQEAPPAGSTVDAGSTVTGCADLDSDKAHDVSFTTDIMNGIFARYRCKNCHTGGGDGKSESKLDLATYATLRQGGGRSGAAIVINGMPCESILYQKTTAQPPFGRRMPRETSSYLTSADAHLLNDWIFEGAHEN